MNESRKTILIDVVTAIIVFVFFAFLYRAAYSWTNPSGNPTTGGGSIFFTGSNMGIGTTTPGFALGVEGSIRATGNIKQGGVDIIPAGTIAYFNLSSCPSGWSEYTSAQGRYLVGLVSGGTLAATVGTALTSNLENRTVGSHSHTNTISNPTHTHTTSYPIVCNSSTSGCWGYQPTADSGTTVTRPVFGFRPADASAPVGPGVSADSGTSGVTLTNSSSGTNISATSGTNAPYMQLLVCEKS